MSRTPEKAEDSIPVLSAPGGQPNRNKSTRKIRLKCHHNEDIRAVNITDRTPFLSLLQRLQEDYGFDVILKYQDSDGDMISLATQNDLDEFLEHEMSSGSGTVNARIVVQRAGHSSPIPYSDTSSKGRNSPCAPAPLTPPSHVSSDLHHTPKKFSHSKAATLVPLATRMPTQPGDECSSPLPLSSPSNGIATMSFGRREPSHSSHSPSLPEPEELGARRNKSLEPLRRRWRRGEVLGQGAFGKVYMGMDLTTGELMAVKVVRGEDLGSLEHEVAVMQALSHDNIVRYLGTDRSPGEPLSIFLEYVPGGSVRSLLDRFGPFEEAVIRVYSRQLLLGLAYLHSNGIAHRDIKGGNVLVSSDGTVKLADFGASKRFVALTESVGEAGAGGSGDSNDHLVKGQPRSKLADPQRVAAIAGSGKRDSRNSRNSGSTVGKGKAKGTPLWMAPEVVKEDPLTQLGWQKADVWSFGCTVVEMATAKSPWAQYDNPVTALFYIACSEEIPLLPPRGLSSAGVDMLMLCFTRDPTCRPECGHLIQHSFIAKDQSAEEESSGSGGEHHWQQHPPSTEAHHQSPPPHRNTTSREQGEELLSADTLKLEHREKPNSNSLNSQHSSDTSPFAAFRYRPPVAAAAAPSSVSPHDQSELAKPRVWDAYRDHKKNATLLRNEPLKNVQPSSMKKPPSSNQKSPSPSTSSDPSLPSHGGNTGSSGGGGGLIHWPLEESFDANSVGRGRLNSGLHSQHSSAPSSTNPSNNASPFANESSDSEVDAQGGGGGRANCAVAPLPTPNDVRGSSSSSGGLVNTFFTGFSAPPPTPEMGMFGLRRPPLGPVATGTGTATATGTGTGTGMGGAHNPPIEGSRPRSASEGSDSGVKRREAYKPPLTPTPTQTQPASKTLNPLPARRVRKSITVTVTPPNEGDQAVSSPIAGGSWRNGRVQNDNIDETRHARGQESNKKSSYMRVKSKNSAADREEKRRGSAGGGDGVVKEGNDIEQRGSDQFEYSSTPRRRSIIKREEAATMLIKELEKKKRIQLAELETAKLYTQGDGTAFRKGRSVSQPDPIIKPVTASSTSGSDYSDSDESSSSADTASHTAKSNRIAVKMLSDVSETSEGGASSPRVIPTQRISRQEVEEESRQLEKDNTQASETDNKSSRTQTRRGGNRSRGAADNILDPLPLPLSEPITVTAKDITAKDDNRSETQPTEREDVRVDAIESRKKNRRKGGGYVDRVERQGSRGEDKASTNSNNKSDDSRQSSRKSGSRSSRGGRANGERLIDYPKGHVFGHGGAISALSLLLYPQDGRNVDNGLGTTLMMASGDREGVVKLFRAPPLESVGDDSEESEGSGWKCVATLSHSGWRPGTSSTSSSTSSQSSRQYQHQNSMARTTPSLSYDPPHEGNKGLVRVSSSENLTLSSMPSQMNSKLARSSSVPVGVSAAAAAAASSQTQTSGNSGFGITAMQLASTGAVISGSDNGTLYVWDLASGNIMNQSAGGGGKRRGGNTHVPTALFIGHEGKVSKIVLETAGPGRDCGNGGGGSGCGGSSGGDWTGKFVTCGADHSVRLFDVRVKRPLVFKFTGHTDAVGALLLDSDKACVVSGSKDGTVRAFDLRTGKNRLEMTTHLGGVVCLAMDPTGDEGRGVYMSGAKDSTVNVWARNGQGLKTLRSHKGVVTCLAMRSVEGKSTRLASGSSDGCMRIWDHHEGKCVKSFTTSQGGGQGGGGILCSAWGPPGMILAGCADSSVRVWSTRTGSTLATWNSSRRGHGGAVTQLLTDKHFAFTGAKDGSVRVWPLGQSESHSRDGSTSVSPLPPSTQEHQRQGTGH